MTVAELIAELQKHPGYLPVVTLDKPGGVFLNATGVRDVRRHPRRKEVLMHIRAVDLEFSMYETPKST